MDTQQFKEKLEEELKTLSRELETIAQRNTSSEEEDWEAKGAQEGVGQADPNERADAQESYELNATVLKDIEVRYNNVKSALKRIEDGTYGICTISGEKIEEDRLEANPAATTCKAHMDQE